MTTSGFAASAYASSHNFLQAGSGGGLSAPSGAKGGGGFEALLSNALGSVAESGRAAEAQATLAATGKADLVDVVTAVAETETALQTMVAVRDRVISAYEEIMRMQI